MSDDKTLITDLADKLSDAMERRQKERLQSIPKLDKEKPFPGESQMMEQKERIRQLAKARKGVYSGAKGVIGSVSPQAGQLVGLGEQLEEFVRGIKETIRAIPRPQPQAKPQLPPRPATESSRPKLPPPNLPATGGLPRPASDPPRGINVEQFKEELMKKIESMRPTSEPRPEAPSSAPRQEQPRMSSIERQREQKKAEMRALAYSGARGAVGAISPTLGSTMDLGHHFKNLAVGIRGMMSREQREAEQRKQIRSTVAGLPGASMAPSAIPPPAMPQAQAPSRPSLRTGAQTDLTRTIMAGGEDNDIQGIREGTLNLGELTASQREEEHVENLPAVEQEPKDMEFNVSKQENLLDKKSTLSVHRRPVSQDSSSGGEGGDIVSTVVGIATFPIRQALGL